MSISKRIDFIGIGASRSGTTWLGHMLDAHPGICMSVPKEVCFFNDRPMYCNWEMDQNYPRGLSWYEKHFNHCLPGTIRGEITPGYSTDALAAERIYAYHPHIKLLYCVRSPVDRIESHYNFAKYFAGKENRTMENAVREEPELIEMSLYYKNLSVYLRHFNPDQILLIWFEDIRHQPEMVLEEVYAFLGADPLFRPSALHKKSNQGRKFRFKGLQKLTRAVNQMAVEMGFSGLIRKLKNAGLGEWMMKINSKPLQKDLMPEELKTHIISLVRSDIDHLEKWSGRNLKNWLQ